MAASKYIPPTREPLYALAQALELRYPGARVTCELYRFEDGHERIISTFRAARAEVLINLGLAERPGTHRHGAEELSVPRPGVETAGGGYIYSDHAYVSYVTDDGVPNVGRGRTFPLKKTQREFERIWKRITAPPRTSATSAGDTHGRD